MVILLNLLCYSCAAHEAFVISVLLVVDVVSSAFTLTACDAIYSDVL